MFYHDISPILLELGPLQLRWYGLMFVIGLILTFLVLVWIFKREKLRLIDLESVAIYLFVGMVVGARFGHIVFYDLDYYLANPLDILAIWKGGLASHGAAIGVLVAYLLWIWIHKKKFTLYSDLLVIGFPITAGFVRIGNFFNSEIVGRATDGSWGVVFQRLNEDFPRHPSQLYESGLSFAIFVVLFVVYLKWFKKLPPLFILFLYVFLYFITRFLVEFWKERHVLSYDIPLSMGQWLSILPVLIALGYFGWMLLKKKKQTNRH